MRTTTINLYSINELSPEAQEKAIKEWRENDDLPLLEEYMNDRLQAKLEQHKIEGDAQIRYSLSHCQGDGVSFTGTFEYKGQTYEVKVTDHHYQHAYTCSITDFSETESEALEADFKEVYLEICRQLEKEGYNYIEDMQSDETIKETLLINEYEYTENGDFWKY